MQDSRDIGIINLISLNKASRDNKRDGSEDDLVILRDVELYDIRHHEDRGKEYLWFKKNVYEDERLFLCISMKFMNVNVLRKAVRI